MDKDVVLGELEINLQETQNKDISEEWFELQMLQENQIQNIKIFTYLEII